MGNGRFAVFSVLLLALALPVAAARAGDDDVALLHEQRKALETDIKNMITDLSCEADSDCRILPFGYKTCSGYQEALLYSIRTVDERILWAKSFTFYKLDRHLTKGMYGVCTVPVLPTVACVDHICTKRTPPDDK